MLEAGIIAASGLVKGPYDQDWLDRWKKFTSEYDPLDYVSIFSKWCAPDPLGVGSRAESPLDDLKFGGQLFDDSKKRNEFWTALQDSWPATY